MYFSSSQNQYELPFIIVKAIETLINANEIKYTIILNHHGRKIFLIFEFFFVSLKSKLFILFMRF